MIRNCCWHVVGLRIGKVHKNDTNYMAINNYMMNSYMNPSSRVTMNLHVKLAMSLQTKSQK